MGIAGFCVDRSDTDDSSQELSPLKESHSRKNPIPIHAELFIEFCSSLQAVDLWNVARMRGAQMLPDVALLTQKLKEPGYRKLVSSILSGDVHSLETMAVRFCEYQYSQHVYYTEVRVDPFNFVTDEFGAFHVTHSLLRGFSHGSNSMEIVVKIILELREPSNAGELLRIAKRTRQQGVVGFSIPASIEFEGAISEIQKAGFGITMPAYTIWEIEFALEHGIQRLGNAFECVNDDKLYGRVLNQYNGIFIECCITLASHEGHDHPVRNHPILSFKDGVHFGFCSGKPMHCGTTFSRERDIVKTQFFGYFTRFFLETTTVWSIEHSFLSETEKTKVLQHLSKFLRISNKIPVE